jgi:methionyl-tRNA formyltransferase
MINPESTLKKGLKNNQENIRFALFANGANFSCRVLQQLIENHFPPDLIVLPDYPAAREQSDSSLNFKSKIHINPIIAISNGIPIEYAPRKEQAALIPVLLEQSFDYLLVACWPYLINNAITQTALKAALNLHPSLLPHYRGPDPVEMQMAENEKNHGVSLHLLSQRFDQGDIVSQARIDNIDDHDRLSIENHCAITGVELFIKAAEEFDLGWELVNQPD